MPDISYIESANHLAAKEVQWRTAIGRFILSFGSIEWFTYHMLSELPTERIFESVMFLGFKQRLNLVIQLVQEKNLDDEITSRVIDLLNEAKELADTRNLIAHNPLLLNLFDDRVGVDLQYQISKYGETEARLTLEKLEMQCRKVEMLDEQLLIIREEIDIALQNLII
jgi:hypothetical protein